MKNKVGSFICILLLLALTLALCSCSGSARGYVREINELEGEVVELQKTINVLEAKVAWLENNGRLGISAPYGDFDAVAAALG